MSLCTRPRLCTWPRAAATRMARRRNCAMSIAPFRSRSSGVPSGILEDHHRAAMGLHHRDGPDHIGGIPGRIAGRIPPACGAHGCRRGRVRDRPRTRWRVGFPSSRTLRKAAIQHQLGIPAHLLHVYCAKSSTPSSGRWSAFTRVRRRELSYPCAACCCPPRMRLRRASGKPSASASRTARGAPRPFAIDSRDVASARQAWLRAVPERRPSRRRERATARRA